jgi:predicted protein tyrosine phosphatase
MDVPQLTIEVASRPEAGDILVSPQRCAQITCLVSIGDSHDKLPAGYENVARKLRLLVADVVTELGATEEDILRIIRLAEGLRSDTGRVLIHCEAGVSRSSAAALIMYAYWLGPGREQEAMERVLSQRPLAIPNRRMIQLADRLLDRGGRLVEALAVSRLEPAPRAAFAMVPDGARGASSWTNRAACATDGASVAQRDHSRPVAMVKTRTRIAGL